MYKNNFHIISFSVSLSWIALDVGLKLCVTLM